MNSKQLNILLADDDTDDCHFFKGALKGFPLTTHLTTVHDGEKLMKLLTEETDKLPDVLFLDLNMPRKNGFECLEEIKHNEKLKQLPIIIISTSFEQDRINLLYKNGAQYYMRKPSDFAQIKQVIQNAVTLIAQELPAGQAGNILQPTRENFVLTI